MKKILFVCTGNTCRSPMAEVIFNHEAKNMKINQEYVAWSAGLYAVNNEMASQNSIKAMSTLGLDISQHRAQRINVDMIEKSHLILTMGVSHKSELNRLFPKFSDKIFTIYEFIQDDKLSDIEDPYGMPLEKYLECANEIKKAVFTIIKKL